MPRHLGNRDREESSTFRLKRGQSNNDSRQAEATTHTSAEYAQPIIVS